MSLERAIAQDPYQKLPSVGSFTATSDDFADGTALAATFAYEGAADGARNRSPQLSWTGAPEGTQSYVVGLLALGAGRPARDDDLPRTGRGRQRAARRRVPRAQRLEQQGLRRVLPARRRPAAPLLLRRARRRRRVARCRRRGERRGRV